MRSPSVSSRLNIRVAAILVVLVAGAAGGGGQWEYVPEEIKATPLWPGEEAAKRLFPGRYVFRDKTGEIVVYWPDPSSPVRWVSYRFWLQNRVDPQIRVEIKRKDDGVYKYRYAVRNGASAKSGIWTWDVVGPPNSEIEISHTTWPGTNAHVAAAPQVFLPDTPNGAFLSWLRNDAPPIEPGSEVSGFEIDCRFLPGFTTAYASGEGGLLHRPPAEFSEEVEEQVIPLERAYVMRKPAVTFGPRFSPGSPMAAILTAYRKDVAALVKMGMLDETSGFVQELQQILERPTVPDRTRGIVVTRAPQSLLEKELNRALVLATQTPQE